MGENSGEPQQPIEAEWDKRMAEVDAMTSTPGDRAMKVYDILRANPELNTWDVMCFCVEWMALMTAIWPWLEHPARSVSRMVYYAHYFKTKEIMDVQKSAADNLPKSE